MDAPVITSLTDKLTGDELVIALSNPIEAVSLIVLYKDTTSTSWTQQAAALSSSIDLTVPTAGKLYEVAVVAVDVDGDYSLPSNPRRAIATTGEGTIARRIEKDIISNLSAIAEVDGYFDDITDTWRFNYPKDVEDIEGFFVVTAFESITQDIASHLGTDVLDEQIMTVSLGCGYDGRDGTSDFIPDKVHEMIAAIKTAIYSDRSRSQLAIDTTPEEDGLNIEGPLKQIADAACFHRFNVRFRIPRTDAYCNKAC